MRNFFLELDPAFHCNLFARHSLSQKGFPLQSGLGILSVNQILYTVINVSKLSLNL